MNKNEKIAAFTLLSEKIASLTPSEIQHLADVARVRNGWFDLANVKNALEGIAFMLDPSKLEKWLFTYDVPVENPKIVGIVMAGNIPLVGFHDLLCVLAAGHVAVIKPSSDDSFLVETLVGWIAEVEPRLKKNIEIRDKLTGIDAVLATGSDNTARYFEYYFRKIPHIIRKNRTSVAILDGSETDNELAMLGMDIFSYFGLGCRNVSKVYTPKGFDLTSIFPSFEAYSSIAHHNKYRNNYDYHKSIYLVNKTPHLDTGFLLVTSTNELVSPISVLYHQEYENMERMEQLLKTQEDKIQCIVSKQHTPFGAAQRPELWDYADNVDVLGFLSGL